MASSPVARLLRIWLGCVAASAPQPKGTATWPRGPRVTCAWDAAAHALRVSWPQAVGPAPLPLAADLYEINIAASPLATASGVHVTGGLSAELGLDVLLPETTYYLVMSAVGSGRRSYSKFLCSRLVMVG